MSILESVALQRRFDLAEPDLEIIRTWIEKTGIRWGIDAAHRAALGLPEFGENSWRAGLDRLLLGYAAPAHGEQLFDGILAFDEVEGSLAETLGHFAEFAESLFAHRARRCSSRARSPNGRMRCAKSACASSSPTTSANRSCGSCDASSIR